MNPSKTAILVLDVQPVIMGFMPGSEEACLANIIKLIEEGRRQQCKLAFIRVAFRDEEWVSIPSSNKYFHGMKMQSNSLEAVPSFLHAEDAAAAFHPHIHQRFNHEKDISIRKQRYGPFVKTSLLAQLLNEDIETLIIIGFKTSGAVLSAVRFAADHDLNIIVVSDAVYDSESTVHEVLINKIFPEQAHVMNTEETIQNLRRA